MFSGIHFLADMYMCGELESAAQQFIYQNFLEVMHCEEFFQLSEERLVALLKCDKLQVTNEQQVMEAVSTWLQWDPTNRYPCACNIIQYVKLPLLERTFLENVVVQSEFVKNCPKCQLLISKAITAHHDENSLRLVTPRAQPLCIYVLGGRNGTDCQLKSTERYDFLLDQWNTVVSDKAHVDVYNYNVRYIHCKDPHNGLLLLILYSFMCLFCSKFYPESTLCELNIERLLLIY